MTTNLTDTGQKTFAAAVEKAIAHSGMGVLDGETQLYSLVSDFLGNAPQSKQSLNLLRNAIECGIPPRLYGAASKDTAEQTLVIATCSKLLMDSYGISEKVAEQFVQDFAAALGWELTALAPAAGNAPLPKQARPQESKPHMTSTSTPEALAQAPSAGSSGQTSENMERIGKLDVIIDPQWANDIICNMNSRRGLIKGLEDTKGGEKLISGMVPELEMDGFEGFLAQLTSGKGRYTYTYDHDQPMPAAIAKRLKEQANSNAIAAVNPLEAENANAMNLFNGGRVAYYDGWYYYSDLRAKSLFGGGGLYRCKIGQPASKECIFKQSDQITHINIVDGFLYACHCIKHPNAEIIRINLKNPKDCTSLYQDIRVSGYMNCPGLQYEGGWLYFSKYTGCLCRMRTDGSDVTEIGKEISRGFIKDGVVLYDFLSLPYKNQSHELRETMLNVNHAALRERGMHIDAYQTVLQTDKPAFCKVRYGESIYYTQETTGTDTPSTQRYRLFQYTYYEDLGVDGETWELCEQQLHRALINIQKDFIYYVGVGALRKMRVDGTGDQVICRLENSGGVEGILVFDDWIFLDYQDSGVLAISHDGKQQQLLK